MKFSVITLFPEMFEGVFNYSIISRAKKEGKLETKFINLRDFGIGRHKIVDDKPYGGGIGMVLRVDVLHKALNSVISGGREEKIVLLDARGTKFNQSKAENLSKLNHIVIICGRYEGFDERIKGYVDYVISIGDYVLTGGEIPAMAIIDSVSRLIPNVLSKKKATELESFSKTGNKRILEHAQYTRPEKYNGTSVPEVLLSGNEKKINEFRLKEALSLTEVQRPDLA